MIKATARSAQAREREIRNRINKADFVSNHYIDQLGLDVSQKMVDTPGKILKPPTQKRQGNLLQHEEKEVQVRKKRRINEESHQSTHLLLGEHLRHDEVQYSHLPQHEGGGVQLGHEEDNPQSEENKGRLWSSMNDERPQGSHLLHGKLLQHEYDESHQGQLLHQLIALRLKPEVRNVSTGAGLGESHLSSIRRPADVDIDSTAPLM